MTWPMRESSPAGVRAAATAGPGRFLPISRDRTHPDGTDGISAIAGAPSPSPAPRHADESPRMRSASKWAQSGRQEEAEARSTAGRTRSQRGRLAAWEFRWQIHQSFTLKGRQPGIPKPLELDGDRLTPREDHKILTSHQVVPHLPRQLPEQALGPISRHR